MKDLLILMLFNSLFIFGLNYLLTESYLVSKIRLKKVGGDINHSEYSILFPAIWTKPLFSCVMCMASIWGSIFYWFYIWDVTAINLIVWVAYCVALCGLNKIISRWV